MAHDVMKYKDFLGSVHYSAADERFVGRIAEIDDLVTFEGSSVAELQRAFEEAVEDYIELCAAAGKPAGRSFKGTFNVRITPELHRNVFRCAVEDGISLNQFVLQALEHEVARRTPSYRSEERFVAETSDDGDDGDRGGSG
ncbi:MAG: type II toxin-antitoxin system HicB family antitoxin [Spirochaeta sp.]|jgi:predicted HicB family RNase H-like nuclease|nr:type II toxin-antitoxin system HicB family antitoxin [Spirochaeta sp.]